jgi:hypothetical protein
MENEFSYQFNVQFIKKNNEWSKSIVCRTYSVKSYIYLYVLVGDVISNFQIKEKEELIKHMENIENKKTNDESGYLITDEGCAGLLFQGEKVKLLDLMLPDDGIIDGIQGPINYNITTPIEYQFIDTNLITKLILEWLVFLSEQENMMFVPKSYIKAEFQ